MPGLAPFAPAIAGVLLGTAGMVDANVQNKATIKNAENAQNAALAQTQKNQTQAQQNLSNYNAQNPGPVQGGPSLNSYSGASIPIVGQGGAGPTGVQQMNPQAIQQLVEALQQKGG